MPTTTAQHVKAAGFSHVLTYGGPVPVDDWQPYGKSPEDVACTFELDGDTLREIPNDPNRATVGGLLVTGLWRLARLATFYVVRVNDDPLDTHAAETLDDAMELAMPDDGATVHYGTVTARDAGAARLLKPRTWILYTTIA